MTRQFRPRAVDATGAIRRLQALVAIGYDVPLLRARLGVADRTTARLLHEDTSRIQPDLDCAIRQLFAELDERPVPLEQSLAPRQLARENGWVGSLGWDDIDSPREKPKRNFRPFGARPAPKKGHLDEIAIELAMSGEPALLTRTERLEAIRRLHARRTSDAQIAALLRVPSRTILRNRTALGLPAHSQADLKETRAA